MLNLAVRNCRLFFRQKSAVFFSLLGVFIVIGLYVLFLGDVWISDLPDLPGVRALMGCWVIAGIVSITPVTTAMGAFEIMVEDRSRGTIRDFFAAPVRRSSLVGGYVISAYLVGLLMSVVAFLLGQLYILSAGGEWISGEALLKMVLLLPLSTLASSALVFFMVSFFHGNAAFSAASTVVGTLIGFLTGIYLPIGSLPEAVQWVIKLFPVSHTGALMRQILLEEPMKLTFAGVPAESIADFEKMMGVTFAYGGTAASPALHLAVLAGTALLFFLLAVWNMSRQKVGS